VPLNVIHASLLGFKIQAPFFANHLLIGGKVFLSWLLNLNIQPTQVLPVCFIASSSHQLVWDLPM
jgi:hypothetical protein